MGSVAIYLLCGVFLLGLLVLVILSGIRFIPNNRIGVVEKRFSFGKGSVKSGLIALNGEAGYQPQVLRGGLHYLMPFQYVVHTMPLVTISQGKIGYIFARDGRQLEPSQVLASNVAEINAAFPGLRMGVHIVANGYHGSYKSCAESLQAIADLYPGQANDIVLPWSAAFRRQA